MIVEQDLGRKPAGDCIAHTRGLAFALMQGNIEMTGSRARKSAALLKARGPSRAPEEPLRAVVARSIGSHCARWI